ncbi:hypothetical protein [Hymenobacter cheonanensis]|uniref:hypothetical protein n=1 Tax=Hymenobacter sp. CA2-7 TaxID=3063993 RepID=UPI0027124590|nr:hypothetical protein [Hymenobacter sp. CA2-7]MDO7885403.1 hypothetical protein [Hymenobacter sp. CA2-7]
MKNFLFCVAVTALLAGNLLAAAAQMPGINARQRNERARIRQGVRSGELTRSEAARMRGREAGITAEKRAARADGIVTRGERHDIRRTENSASRAIYRQKHDRQVR